MTFTWEQKEFNTLGVSASHCVCVCYWSYSIVYIDEFGAGSPPNLGIYKVFFPFFSSLFLSGSQLRLFSFRMHQTRRWRQSTIAITTWMERIRLAKRWCDAVYVFVCVCDTYTRPWFGWRMDNFTVHCIRMFNAQCRCDQTKIVCSPVVSLSLPHCLPVGLSLWLFANIMCKYNAMQMDAKNNSIRDTNSHLYSPSLAMIFRWTCVMNRTMMRTIELWKFSFYKQRIAFEFEQQIRESEKIDAKTWKISSSN